jgi:hypothetical protein
MIEIQTTKGIAYVPNSWHEVTLEGFYHAWQNGDIDLLISGESNEAIELAKPYSCLSFESIDISANCANVDNIVQKFGKMRWAKFLELEMCIRSKNAGNVIASFHKTFTSEELNQMPCTYSVKALMDLLNSYHGFLKPFAMEARYSQAQINAGVQELQTLGTWLTIQELAEAYSLDPDVVLRWNIQKVYVDLFARHKKAEYVRQLNEQANKQ